MLSRPPNKSESGFRQAWAYGTARYRSALSGPNGGLGAEPPAPPQRPLNASFNLENNPCCPG